MDDSNEKTSDLLLEAHVKKPGCENCNAVLKKHESHLCYDCLIEEVNALRSAIENMQRAINYEITYR